MNGKWLSICVGALVSALAMTSTAGQFRRVSTSAAAINPSDFVSVVDNKFFPLLPGTTFFYEGETEGVPATDEFHVTHKTKQILGVACTIVRDQAFENGVLVEDTFDFFAQDKAGNVWYFGEDTKELDARGNVISTEGSWEAGVDGALPGIVMLTDPRKGDQYRQEIAKGVAEDRAWVLSLSESVSVEYGDFNNVLLTKETSRLEPGVVEYKYYAEGVGFILGVMIHGGDEQTELVAITSNNADH